MLRIFRNYTSYGLILLAAANFACNSAQADAGNFDTAGNSTHQAAVREASEAAADAPPKETPSSTSNASAVAGHYEYKTVKKGEGFDNSLDIENKSNGRLHVTIAGSYLFQANGAQTFHEAEGEGDAQLSGNTMLAEITDESDAVCRVRIVFNNNAATVQIPESCQFRIRLGGVYQKAAVKPAPESEPAETEFTEISFPDSANFLDDTKNHRLGEKYLINEVPTAKISGITEAGEEESKDYRAFFWMDFKTDGGDGGGSFLTSAALVKQLRAVKNSSAASFLRIAATLIEIDGGDQYRASFVTKIEALDENGEVLWTAAGTQPARLKFAF